MSVQIDYDAALRQHNIPAHMHYGMRRYLRYHVRPGDFLLRLLRGEVDAARYHADRSNLAALEAGCWDAFLATLPPDSHGSPEKVAAWLARGQRDGPREGEPTYADLARALKWAMRELTRGGLEPATPAFKSAQTIVARLRFED